MPDKYRIRITPRATTDLEQIFGYISSRSPQNARKMIAKPLADIDGLEVFPHRFNVPRAGSVRGRAIRSMPVPPFLVRYRIDEKRKAVHILQVRHGARAYP